MVLSCKSQHTTINLPSAREFYVVDIVYPYSWILLEDPGGCLPRRLLSHSLNFSFSPRHELDYGSKALSSITITKVYYMWKVNLRREEQDQLEIEKFWKEYQFLKPARHTYADIRRMANRFKSEIGQGGYGCVFSGKLHNGRSVAVKVLERSNGNV
ncbi:hypothetical protein ACLOJK_009960 [Asimina triloba]